MILFGKIKGAENDWGFDFFTETFESFIEVEDEKHIEMITRANDENKKIVGDENGNPILVDLPRPTEEELKKQRISELERYLSQTDWYAIRFADTGEPIPEGIKQKRQEARDEISEIRNKYPDA